MDDQKLDRAGAPEPGGLYIPFSFPGVPSVACVFSTVYAGDVGMGAGSGAGGHAAVNRRRLLDALGLSRWAELKQMHGNGFVVDAHETPPERAATLEADGHATGKKVWLC